MDYGEFSATGSFATLEMRDFSRSSDLVKWFKMRILTATLLPLILWATHSPGQVPAETGRPDSRPAQTAAGTTLVHFGKVGTWRSFGRLIWGVDDFDEACSLAYTNDLVRLALDAALNVTEERLAMFGDLILDLLAAEVQLSSPRFRTS